MAEADIGAIRIFVGGLGATVTADDLKKTFSTPHLGTVTAIDVIRSKGRSFAYLDFVPSSDKGLAKLFSSYNGCMWKGGRLRLEKAKEHYLLLFGREREEDAELASHTCSDEVDKIESPEKPKKLSDLEKMQLRLFFPKLGKVKLLPFKGTGKHKYSFQRFEAPPLPTHFCDCEEHSGSLYAAKERHSDLPNLSREESFHDHEMESYAVNEEELSMMNLVMNKVFEKKNFSKVPNRKDEFSVETYNAVQSIDESQLAEGLEDQASDEDNLIINIVGGSNQNVSLLENLRAIDNEDLDLRQIQNSKDRPARKMPGSQKRMTGQSAEQTKQPTERKDDNLDPVSAIPDKKRRKILPSNKRKEDKGNGVVSDVSESERGKDTHVRGLDTSGELQQFNSKSVIPKSNGKAAWSQKFSWKNLVQDAGSSNFQISNIAPSVGHGVEVQPTEIKDDNLDPVFAISEKKRKILPSNMRKEDKGHGIVSVISESERVMDTHVQSLEISGGLQQLNSKSGIPKLNGKAACSQKSSRENLEQDAGNSNLQISNIAPSVGHGVEVHPGSESLSEFCFTDEENQEKGSLQREDQKVSAEALPSTENMDGNKATKGALKVSAEALPSTENVDGYKAAEGALKVSAEALPSTVKATKGALEVSAGAMPSTVNVDGNKATKGALWLQKSSWTQLVGDSNRSSFSISQILPNVTFEKQEVEQPVIDFSSSKSRMRQNHALQVSESRGGTKADAFAAHDDSTMNGSADRETRPNREQLDAENNLQIDSEINKASTSFSGKDQPLGKLGDTDTDETFSFVRSAASMKEWMKVKAALSGSLKKKGNQK